MWGKTAALIRTIKGVPTSLSNAGQKSFASLEEAGKIAKRAPQILGQVGSLTAAAVGRVVKKAPSSASARPPRYVPQRTPHEHTGTSRVMVIMLGVLFILALATLNWMYEAFRTVSITSLVLSTCFTIALVSVTVWVWRQFRSWHRLTIVERLQRDLSSPCETAAEEARFRAAFAELRSVANDPQLAKFLIAADISADVANLRDDLDLIGLKAMDKNALDAIRQGTRDVFFLSLVSTNALAEVIIFSIRALGLIRRVADAYGYRPGRFGLIRLARHMLADITLLPIGMLVGLEAGREAGSAIRSIAGLGVQAASAAHPLAGAAVGTIGNVVGSAAEAVTPRVTEAALAAGRMAHFGLLAAAVVRPVAFSNLGYSELRNAIYKQILGLKKDTLRSRKPATADDAAEIDRRTASPVASR